MLLRRILLIALAALLPAIVQADNEQLPSRKVSVVLPLLKQFSDKDGYGRITQVLGKEDWDCGNAYRECFFRLEKSPGIMVKASLDGKKVYFIEHGNEMLYRASLK
jgi:hypothetical protein